VPERAKSDELRGGQDVRTRPEERIAVEGEETQVRHAADGRHAGNVVEERDLAEVIARREGAAEALPCVHSGRALEQHVEAVGRFPLPNDVLWPRSHTTA
jgi:hypothetical protein